jgi:hypothetical protein
METAKVDIRKLQLLNDRINQCIEALNQVRLSVHGLSHTASPFIPAGINPLGQTPLAGGYAGFGQPSVPQGYVPGLAHSTPFPGTSPAAFIPGFAQGLGPFAGLSHTSPEESFARAGWADPLLAVRIAQTFPYVQYPFPAVVSIF